MIAVSEWDRDYDLNEARKHPSKRAEATTARAVGTAATGSGACEVLDPLTVQANNTSAKGVYENYFSLLVA